MVLHKISKFITSFSLKSGEKWRTFKCTFIFQLYCELTVNFWLDYLLKIIISVPGCVQ